MRAGQFTLYLLATSMHSSSNRTWCQFVILVGAPTLVLLLHSVGVLTSVAYPSWVASYAGKAARSQAKLAKGGVECPRPLLLHDAGSARKEDRGQQVGQCAVCARGQESRIGRGPDGSAGGDRY